MFDFVDRAAFVTGGASGIGLGMAKAFAKAGARVAIADVSTNNLDAAVAEAKDEGLSLVPYVLDVTNRRDVSDVADRAEAAIGPITVVALNAGVGILARIRDAGYAEWDWILGVNLGGVMNGVRTFAPRLQKRGAGHVIATASLGGLAVGDGGGIYAASKFAVISAMQCLRMELAPHGIGVSVLCPGVVNTNIYRPHDSRQVSERSSQYVISGELEAMAKAMLQAGMSIDEVGALVVEGIKSDSPYILTHGMGDVLDQRRDAIIASLR